MGRDVYTNSRSQGAGIATLSAYLSVPGVTFRKLKAPTVWGRVASQDCKSVASDSRYKLNLPTNELTKENVDTSRDGGRYWAMFSF